MEKIGIQFDGGRSILHDGKLNTTELIVRMNSKESSMHHRGLILCGLTFAVFLQNLSSSVLPADDVKPSEGITQGVPLFQREGSV